MQTYVHSAQVWLDPGGDAGAPGAAVTVALCGHWEHDPPCRWPHHTAVRDPSGSELTLRVVFAADPAEAGTVRAGILQGLRTGRMDGPNGSTGWELLAENAAEPDPGEWELGARIATR